MGFGTLRERVVSRSFALFGVPITVTLPDSEPIATRGIWLTPETEEVPFGASYQRREPKRVMALKKSDVPTVPRGTQIVAPEKDGDEMKRWRVDSFELAEPEHHRVVLVEHSANGGA